MAFDASDRPDPRRRRLLAAGSGLAALGGLGALGTLGGGRLFVRRALAAAPWAPPGPYGSLRDVVDETTGRVLVRLPEGFRVRSLAWTGDAMADGAAVPDRHDGMAVVAARDGGVTLVRNHERSLGAPVGGADVPVYDDARLPGLGGLAGGCTATEIAAGGALRHRGVLGGTLVNCAGGPTPWGSWLSCEEIVLRGAPLGARDHGFVFEVPDPARGAADARPIRDMGWLRHEAAAVDPRTGVVYLTEDAGPNSGLYRFLPRDASPRVGALGAGGRLQMLAVRDDDGADLGAPTTGARRAVRWVDVPDPTAEPEDWAASAFGLPRMIGRGASGPFLQGRAAGGARFVRLEGAWWRDDRLWFTDTAAGAAESGVLWTLAPGRDGDDELTAVLVAGSEVEADRIDNVTVSPRGGVLMCEDGGGRDATGPDGETLPGGARLIALDAAGAAFPFAENACVLDAPIDGRPAIEPGDYAREEFAGACFAPDGRTLFVNLQTPGVTLAITGPFARGPL